MFLFSKITLLLCYSKLYSGILARSVSLLVYPTSSLLMTCSLVVELIMRLLSDFHHFSGLQPNLGKSVYFFAAVNSVKEEELRTTISYIPEAALQFL